MFCPNCSQERADTSKYCIKCGTELLAHAPKQGRILPPIIIMTVLLIIGTAAFFLISPEGASSAPWFTVTDGELFFDESLYIGGPELTVPSTVDGQTVTSISEDCFRDCSWLTRIYLPNTIEAIGDGAFYDCTGLTGMKLPEGLEQIGSEAFWGCTSLEAMYIPASVTSIESNAFRNCPLLCHVFVTGGADRFSSIYPQIINPFTKIYSVSGPDAQEYTPS